MPRGHTESWRKISLTHGKLAQLDGMSCGSKESWQKVPQPHGMLTENSDARMHEKLIEVDRRSHGCMESWRKLTEGFAATRKVVASWRKAPRPHGMFTEDDTMLHWHWLDTRKVNGRWRNATWRTESWWMVPQMHGKLVIGPTDARKVDGMSQGRTKTWHKSAEDPADAQNVYGRWLKVLLMHKMFSLNSGVVQVVQLGWTTPKSWKNILLSLFRLLLRSSSSSAGLN